MPAFVSLLILDPALRLWRRGCAIALYAAILIMGSVPGARAEIGQIASGLVLHSLAYGSIAFLIFSSCRGTRTIRALKALLTVALAGALDETLQSFLPYRTGSFGDWAIDCTAALFTVALLWAFLPEPANRP